jgi:uncharacterized protein (DUF433 family)
MATKGTQRNTHINMRLTGGKPKVLTDEQVLSIRSRFEFEGATRKELLADYPCLTYETLRNVLDYTTRSKLVPQLPGKRA